MVNMIHLSLLYIVNFILQAVLCLDPIPRVRGSGKVIMAEVGTTVQLICDVSNNRRLKTRWEQCKRVNEDGDCVKSSGLTSKRRPKAPSYYDIRKDGSSTYIVSILQIQPNQAGMYLCTIQSSLLTRKTVDSIQVNVVQKPVIDYLKTSVDVEALEGEAVDLHCEASGYPTPTVVWQRVGSTLLQGGGYNKIGPDLSIKTCNQEVKGQYQCIASNSYGETRHTISVGCLGKPEVQAAPRINHQMLGYQVKLLCNIKSSPEVTRIWWTKDDQEISPTESRYRIESMKAALGRVITKLVITDGVTLDDYTHQYACHAENKHGEKKDTLYIKETNSPRLCNGKLRYAKSSGSTHSSITTLTFTIISFCITIIL